MAKDEDRKAVVSEEEEQVQRWPIVEFSTGVKVYAKPVPSLLMIQVLASDPPPDIPTSVTPNGVVITNPDDPGYIEQTRFYEMKRTKTMINIMISHGTELLEVPKDLPKHTDDSWLDALEVTGMKTKPESKAWRYLFWFQTIAAVTSKDLEKLQTEVGRLSGVPEDDVKSAAGFSGS